MRFGRETAGASQMCPAQIESHPDRANWAHVMVVESSRDATPEEAEAKVKLVWTNNLSEPEE